MENDPPVDLWTLADLCTPWCLHVAVTLRIAQHLAAGVHQVEQLAVATGTSAAALGRVLRHLAERGVFAEPEPGRFELNAAARGLLEEGITLGLDLDGFGGRMAHAWSTLLDAVRTGRAAYDQRFGRPFWDDLAAHPELAARFDALMGPAGHGEPDPEVLIESDWDTVATVCDVGGGTGALLASVLRAQPSVRGILVDLPSTIERASGLLNATGVLDRVTLVGQSFFEPLPAGADVYLLKNVLADWPDAEAASLLKRCAEAAAPGGRVVILGGVTPEGRRVDPELLMLVLVGGKSRSLAEFEALASAAGLEVHRHGKLPSGRFAVECRVRGASTHAKP